METGHFCNALKKARGKFILRGKISPMENRLKRASAVSDRSLVTRLDLVSIYFIFYFVANDVPEQKKVPDEVRTFEED